VHPATEERFGFAEIQVVSFADLYAGKMVAALHRQHPRDLFDVQYLFRNDGINDSLFQTFFAYSVSSTTWFGTNRSIAGDYENWGRDSVRVDLGVFPPRSSQLGLCAHRSRFKIKVVSRIPQTQARSLPAQSVRKIGPGFFRPDDLNHVSSLIGRMAGNYRADRSPHQSR
jgi:hypothetical protein